MALLLLNEKLKRQRQANNWRKWLADLFPSYITAPFAQRHTEFWEWIEMLAPGERPSPLVAIWPRGGAKSTSAELGAVRVGAKKSRRYIWYVSGTQDKADKHVETIASLLESERLSTRYPMLTERMIGKYGNSKGWRRERLRTSSGLTVDALGLDTGSRGAKVEDRRPDMMILDDVDEKHDTLTTTVKKIETITTSILPAGSNDCAVLFIQNLIHPDSIASRLSDGRADFLADRTISGPYPAIDGLTYEQRSGKFYITGGQATWEGQNMSICQGQMDTWGLSAFLQEAQHQVELSGGIWDHIDFQHIEWRELPEFIRVVVWVDPAVTSTDQSDSMGIQAGGIDERDNIIMLYSWESITSPEDALTRAILKAIELGAERVGIETDQGGDTWQSVYDRVVERLQRERPEITNFPAFASDKAGSGYGSKVERNQRMLADYERGKIKHAIGTHAALERSFRRFPKKPLDLADAAFWVWNDLRNVSWLMS